MDDYHPLRVWSISLHISLGSLVFGYQIGVLDPSYDDVCHSFDISCSDSLYRAIITSSLLFGGAVGSLISGKIANKLGRRKAIIIASILSITSSLLVLIPFVIVLIASRFLSGVACGIYVSICPIFLKEYAPAALRGILGSLIQITLTVGLVIAYSLGLILPVGSSSGFLHYWWIIMLIFPGMISTYMLIAFLFNFTEETPYWLELNGFTDRSLEALSYIYTSNGMPNAKESLQISVSKENAKEIGTKISYSELFCSKRYAKMMRLGCLLNLSKRFSGNPSVLFYSALILNQEGGGEFMSRVYATIIGVFNLIFALASFFIIGKFGRKTLILFGELGLGIDCALVGLTPILFGDHDYITATLLFIFMALFQVSLGSITWIYCSEIMNDVGLSVANFVGLLAGFMIVLVFPLAEDVVGFSGVFFFYSFCMFLSVAHCYFDMIETKSLSRIEIVEAIEGEEYTAGNSALLIN